MDTPVLKSGRKTKYRYLPSTAIIFITQDDIFGKDIAKYTFTEQCEEIQGLHLEDGTRKIFLNMTSKNGSKELISLLQYMKDTRLENPEVTVKDKRIIELDQIVTEVKESEEWEVIQMTIYDRGVEEGEKQGIQNSVLEILYEYGEIPSEIEQKIIAEQDVDRLKSWVRLAARSRSIEEFVKAWNR